MIPPAAMLLWNGAGTNPWPLPAFQKPIHLKMTYQSIINLFGYSEFSPEVKAIFPKLHIPVDRPEMSICWRTFQSEKWDVALTFRAKNNYNCDYGPVMKEYTNENDESFLEEIIFGGTGRGIKYPDDLPFNLIFGDSPELVQQKISIKKSESRPASYGSYMVFNLEDYWLLTAFDFDKKLIWLRIKIHEQSFKRKRDLTKSLRLQNKNLSISNFHELQLLKKISPAVAWRIRMKDGDDNLTAKNIEESEKLLSAFLDKLLVATEQKNARSIFVAAKKVTQGFNKLNDRYNNFIETLEREELVDYIHKAIRMTGFKIEPEIDFTEEWREW